jgi:hypothetical protein
MCKQTIAMANRKIIGFLFCLRTNRARNRMAIHMQIRTLVDGPSQQQLAAWVGPTHPSLTRINFFNLLDISFAKADIFDWISTLNLNIISD